MSSQSQTISDEKIYWIQIIITISFGIVAYYVLELIFPYGIPDTVFLHIASLWVVSGIYFILLIGIPILILNLKDGENLIQAVKRSLKSFGTQLCLFILIVGITFLVSI